MNPQILELKEQAMEWVPSMADPDTKIRLLNAEKFAELIVRECMNIARNVGNISEPDDWAPDRCYEIEQRIQDRFGVEQ